MNTDAFIQFLTDMDPADAPPEVIAKLFDNVSSLTKFAKTVADMATQLAQTNELPGYELKKGRTKPLSWIEGAVLPDAWYEKKPITPSQVVTRKLASETTLTKQNFASRPESDMVPVRIGGKVGEEIF